MLQLNKRVSQGTFEAGDVGTSSSLTDTFNILFGIVRRQLPIMLVIVACSIVLGLLYLFTTPPRYTATATMVIDTRKVQLFQQQSVLGETPIDAGTVQTQVEILKSQNVSLAVVNNLHLTEDPEFISGSTGLFGAILRSIGDKFTPSESQSDVQLQRRALGSFDRARTVTRVGLTYVMDIAFQSLDPDKAARIANAVADAYINDQLDAKYQATRRASLWLQDRIKELRVQASAADRAVVEFEQQNNINTVDQSGRLMTDQQMSEVNSQLILAHASTAEAKARLDRMNDIMKQTIPDASVADALHNEVIVNLRQKYLELAGRESIFSNKYGVNHLATVNLRTQMDELRRNISDEMRKIAESYKSDYAIAQARENSIRTSLADSVTDSHITNKAQIQLRELQSTSQSYKSMYDNFLQRYMEAVQQQSFPITEARLISPASRPFGKSSPNTPAVVALSVMAGLLLSFGLAMLREFSDRVFRSSRQVEEKLQLNCLSILPAVKAKRFEKTVRPAGEATSSDVRSITTDASMMRYVVDEPFSRFTEALRSVKVAIDIGNVVKDNKVIGFTSSLPNEGKSTASINFAHLIAHAGARVLLVDGDLRNPSLSRALATNCECGLIEVVAGRKQLEDAVWTDPVSGLYFLPVGGEKKLHHTNEILASERVRQFFTTVRDKFDYVIVDFAPLAPVVDTRTTTSFIDSYVYVIEWGRTKFDVVEHSLGDAREIYERILGVVMNKADLTVLGRYERYRSNYYYRKYYSRYGYTA